MRMIIIIVLLLMALLLLTACEEGGDVMFINAQKECGLNGTYCHLFRTSGDVNITFDVNGTLTYEVQN